MTDRRTSRPWREALLAALGVVLAVAACRVDRPTAPDLVDPVLSEPTIDEMAQLVVALAPWATKKTSPAGAPR